ncbi:MAG: YraN family protein [Planctomycetes bacterium]|nr:YraN family protein [Planctomycetota bacterium]
MHGIRGAIDALRARRRARARRELCARGESLAARHLAEQGYTELARNLRIGHDEADLVMLSPCGTTLIVVEVKTRSDPGARPEERIDHGKRASLTRLARTLAEQPALWPLLVRFDVLAIVLVPGLEPELRHFIDAWEPGSA